jgi:hypothetical protein
MYEFFIAEEINVSLMFVVVVVVVVVVAGCMSYS